jgi:hypothetical protein
MLKSKRVSALAVLVGALFIFAVSWQLATRSSAMTQGPSPSAARRTAGATVSPGTERSVMQHAQQMIEDGRQIFRYETFGSETFWGDALQLHKAIAGAKNGGFRRPSVSRA